MPDFLRTGDTGAPFLGALVSLVRKKSECVGGVRR